MDRALLAWGLRSRRNTTRSMAGVLTRRHNDRLSPRHDAVTGQTAPPLPKPWMPNPRLPRLWLFTDHRRLPDPRAAVAALPPARAGVVLRHDCDPARATLGRDLARICCVRRLVLVVAGDPRLAASLGAGVHLRAGRWPGVLRPRGMVTSSAHGVADMRRAVRAGADLVFLSPAFRTASHPGAPGLGPLRWGLMARRLPLFTKARLAALGGVDGDSVRRLPAGRCHAAGAITALFP